MRVIFGSFLLCWLMGGSVCWGAAGDFKDTAKSALKAMTVESAHHAFGLLKDGVLPPIPSETNPTEYILEDKFRDSSQISDGDLTPQQEANAEKAAKFLGIKPGQFVATAMSLLDGVLPSSVMNGFRSGAAAVGVTLSLPPQVRKVLSLYGITKYLFELPDHQWQAAALVGLPMDQPDDAITNDGWNRLLKRIIAKHIIDTCAFIDESLKGDLLSIVDDLHLSEFDLNKIYVRWYRTTCADVQVWLGSMRSLFDMDRSSSVYKAAQALNTVSAKKLWDLSIQDVHTRMSELENAKIALCTACKDEYERQLYMNPHLKPSMMSSALAVAHGVGKALAKDPNAYEKYAEELKGFLNRQKVPHRSVLDAPAGPGSGAGDGPAGAGGPTPLSLAAAGAGCGMVDEVSSAGAGSGGVVPHAGDDRNVWGGLESLLSFAQTIEYDDFVTKIETLKEHFLSLDTPTDASVQMYHGLLNDPALKNQIAARMEAYLKEHPQEIVLEQYSVPEVAQFIRTVVSKARLMTQLKFRGAGGGSTHGAASGSTATDPRGDTTPTPSVASSISATPEASPTLAGHKLAVTLPIPGEAQDDGGTISDGVGDPRGVVVAPAAPPVPTPVASGSPSPVSAASVPASPVASEVLPEAPQPAPAATPVPTPVAPEGLPSAPEVTPAPADELDDDTPEGGLRDRADSGMDLTGFFGNEDDDWMDPNSVPTATDTTPATPPGVLSPTAPEVTPAPAEPAPTPVATVPAAAIVDGATASVPAAAHEDGLRDRTESDLGLNLLFGENNDNWMDPNSEPIATDTTPATPPDVLQPDTPTGLPTNNTLPSNPATPPAQPKNNDAANGILTLGGLVTAGSLGYLIAELVKSKEVQAVVGRAFKKLAGKKVAPLTFRQRRIAKRLGLDAGVAGAGMLAGLAALISGGRMRRRVRTQ